MGSISVASVNEMREERAPKSALLLPAYPKDPVEPDPPLLHEAYKSTVSRSPLLPPIDLPQRLTELTGPVFGADRICPLDYDLTLRHANEPLGQRIILHGKVLETNGRPIPDTLIEIWQANASGRYRHVVDNWPAPLDPNFTGYGRTMTDDQGNYRFVTIRPGAYPWGNHENAWRPAHIHFSLFGAAFTQRLVTQMYFPDDPLMEYDPIFNAVRDPKARQRLIAAFDLENTEPSWALAYRFDLVLRGKQGTPFEDEGADA